MEKNKRTKNSILLGFIGSLLIIIILTFIIFLRLKPDIEEVELMKDSLKKDYDYFVATSKTGISFIDFKSFVNGNLDIKKDLYILSVINSIDKDFYSKNILNNTPSSFDDFIIKKQNDLNPREIKVYGKEEKINKVLPIYSDDIRFGNKGIMNDFHLINKIESFFKTFELSYGGNISIQNLTPAQGFESSKIVPNIEPNEDGTIEQSSISTETSISKGIQTDIFLIPMNIKVSGTKLNIQYFLHYLENVGNFKIVGNDIDFYKDNIIKNLSGEKKVLYNDDVNDLEDYNIYNNQLVNIKNIKINNKFIDNTVSLNEIIDLDVEIEFFVRGIPNYKMQEFVNKFLSDYKELNTEVDKNISTTKNSSIQYNKIKEEKFLKIKNYLSTMDAEVKSINTDLGNIDKLELIYKKTLEYNKNLLNIKALFSKI